MGIQNEVDNTLTPWFFDADMMPGVETIAYTPKGGVSRNISAHVIREPIGSLASDLSAAPMLITVRNDNTSGISTATLDSSGDTVTLAYRVGGTSRTYRLGPPIDQDDDVLSFRVHGRGD